MILTGPTSSNKSKCQHTKGHILCLALSQHMTGNFIKFMLHHHSPLKYLKIVTWIHLDPFEGIAQFQTHPKGIGLRLVGAFEYPLVK